MNSDVEIGTGNLANRGVYAKKNFNKNEIVLTYNLIPISETNYRKLPEEEKQFTHTHRGQIYLYSEPERYVNHSNNPNTYQDFETGADRALREIRIGEMITTNANKDDI